MRKFGINFARLKVSKTHKQRELRKVYSHSPCVYERMCLTYSLKYCVFDVDRYTNNRSLQTAAGCEYDVTEAGNQLTVYMKKASTLLR